MNILIVNPNLIMGGAQKILLGLAHELSALGHRVSIYTTLYDREGLAPEHRSLPVHVSRHRILKRGGTTTRYRNVNILALAWRLPAIRREIKELIRQERIDLVLAHQPPAPWLCSFLDVPVIWNCFEPIALWKPHRPGYFSLRPMSENPLTWLLEELYERLDRAIVRSGVPHIVVLSKRLQAQVRALYGREAEVIYVGSDRNDRQEAAGLVAQRADSVFRILQVGQFTVEKNHALTLEMLRRIIERRLIPRVELTLVGEGDLRPTIERLTAELDLSAHVRILGAFPINDPRLAAAFQGADVLVFPSVNQSWGLVPFEALAHGVVPVVSSDCGASELIEEHAVGYVADPDPERFVEQVVHVFRNPEEAIARAGRGRRLVETDLTYAAYARRFASRFEAIAGRAAAPAGVRSVRDPMGAAR